MALQKQKARTLVKSNQQQVTRYKPGVKGGNFTPRELASAIHAAAVENNLEMDCTITTAREVMVIRKKGKAPELVIL